MLRFKNVELFQEVFFPVLEALDSIGPSGTEGGTPVAKFVKLKSYPWDDVLHKTSFTAYLRRAGAGKGVFMEYH